MKQLKPLFPVPTLQAIIDDQESINTRLLTELDKVFDSESKKRILSHKWASKEWTTEKHSLGYTNFDPSNPDSLTTDPNFKFFFDHLEPLVAEFFAQLDYYDRWHFVNGWASVYPKGAWVPLHNHSPLHWSASYYVKTHEGCGNILFTDPKEYALANEPPGTRWRGDCGHSVEPTDGMLLIFPSYLKHETLPNEVDEDRIIISFNIKTGMLD
jgi:uncharacterized protein (TIGR02466 family)|tara:strand:+ start:66 stop:701 length:636 start_codon:yes stop_codon:yes gene_type:complete